MKQDQLVIARMDTNVGAVCMEKFKEFTQMGRFTLRDEGQSVCINVVYICVYAI